MARRGRRVVCPRTARAFAAWSSSGRVRAAVHKGPPREEWCCRDCGYGGRRRRRCSPRTSGWRAWRRAARSWVDCWLAETGLDIGKRAEKSCCEGKIRAVKNCRFNNTCANCAMISLATALYASTCPPEGWEKADGNGVWTPAVWPPTASTWSPYGWQGAEETNHCPAALGAASSSEAASGCASRAPCHRRPRCARATRRSTRCSGGRSCGARSASATRTRCTRGRDSARPSGTSTRSTSDRVLNLEGAGSPAAARDTGLERRGAPRAVHVGERRRPAVLLVRRERLPRVGRLGVHAARRQGAVRRSHRPAACTVPGTEVDKTMRMKAVTAVLANPPLECVPGTVTEGELLVGPRRPPGRTTTGSCRTRSSLRSRRSPASTSAKIPRRCVATAEPSAAGSSTARCGGSARSSTGTAAAAIPLARSRPRAHLPSPHPPPRAQGEQRAGPRLGAPEGSLRRVASEVRRRRLRSRRLGRRRRRLRAGDG